MNLRYLSLPLTAWLQCSGVAALSSGVVLKTDLSLTISSSNTEFAADKAVLINVSLKNNNPKKAAQILDWVVPCDIGDQDDDVATDMYLFNVKTTSGAVVPYLGAKIKRTKPDDVKDFKVLQPGDEISCTIDLAKYFDFAAPSVDNDYGISYEAAREELSGNPSESEDARPVEALQSNALKLTIHARYFAYPIQRYEEIVG